MDKIGVLLMNLGGPERITDVGPFLYNLFSDPEIIRTPFPVFQKPLAWLISTLRSTTSQQAYLSIGGGSPIRRITEQQARELQSKLRDKGFNATTYIAMRYWHPFTESAIADELISEQISLCESPSKAHIFFTAHGVPKSYVEEAGDPYKQQIEDCSLLIINELEKCLGHSNPHTLSYQSRVGPVEWLKPYTEEVLADLGRSNVNDLIVVPISFVGEHIETLQEIDIEYKEIAEKAGIKNFRRVKALNTHPTFIEGLSDLVISCLEGPLVNIEEASQLPEKVKLYPQEKWQWGWNNSSEVWNGRVAMIIFLVLFIELISGSGPLHKLGIL